MKQAWVTGASSGLGRALATELSVQGWQVVGISRSKGDLPPHVSQLTLDLSSPAFLKSLSLSASTGASEILLINNAGSLGEIGYCGQLDALTLERTFFLNLTAPALLCNQFIGENPSFRGRITVLNIGSGAGSNPYDGWSAYCSTKSGLDMLTRVVALENQSNELFRAFSVAPGIIQTPMQAEIRATDEQRFSQVKRFVQLHEEGALRQPEEVAKSLLHFFTGPAALPSGVYDLRKLEQS